MNRATKLGKKKISSASDSNVEPSTKKQTSIPNLRNPLKDLNTSISTRTSASSSSSSFSSSVSVEAPRGCLSFLRPINSSSNQNLRPKSTPKSAPHPRISSSNPRSKPPTRISQKPISHKSKKTTTTPSLKQWQNGKSLTFQSPAPDLQSEEKFGAGSCLNQGQDGKDPNFKRSAQTPHSTASSDGKNHEGGIHLEKLGSVSSLQKKQWSFSRTREGEPTELRSVSFEKACLDVSDHHTPVIRLVYGSGFDSTSVKEDKSPMTDIKTIPCFNQWQCDDSSNFKPPTPTPESIRSPDLDGKHFNGESKETFGFRSCLEESSQKNQWSFSRTSDPNQVQVTSLGKTCLDFNDHSTPLNKFVKGSAFDSMDTTSTTTTTKTTTPPVEASLSPEIHHGSSLNSITSSCFGAGHVLSGVTDKRKCRPRGILTVGEELGFPEDSVTSVNDRNDSFLGLLNNSTVTSVPSPTEAAVHWLLSPCKEEDHNDSPQHGSPKFRDLMGPTPFQSLSSPSSGLGFSFDIRGNSNSSSNASSTARRGCLIPSEHIEFGGFVGYTPPNSKVRSCYNQAVSCSSSSHATCSCKAALPHERGSYRYELTTENTPLSGDSLRSQNVICTPESDPSVDRLVQLSRSKNEQDQLKYHFEIDSMAEVLSATNLSPNNRTSMWDPADVLPLPGFSFQFTHQTSPSDFSADSQLTKTFNDQNFGVSSTIFRKTSQPQTRISWREGLVSRIFEMDELDYCRCLSDEEEDINVSGNYKFDIDTSCELQKNVDTDPIFAESVMSAEFLTHKSKGKLPSQGPTSCAESIIIDGGGLISSGDSDWAHCYKNQLFKI